MNTNVVFASFLLSIPLVFGQDPSPSISIPEVKGIPGQTVTFDLRIENNYNNSVGKFVSMEWEMKYSPNLDSGSATVTVEPGPSANVGYTLFCNQVGPGTKRCAIVRFANMGIPDGVIAHIKVSLPANFVGRGEVIKVVPTVVDSSGDELTMPELSGMVRIPPYVLRGRGR